MNRSALLTALLVGTIGMILAPRFGPTAAFPPLVVLLVCSLGALTGLWGVSYALEREAQR